MQVDATLQPTEIRQQSSTHSDFSGPAPSQRSDPVNTHTPDSTVYTVLV